jgi:drug/metabolite transporter (DMT)-like permease
MEAKLSPRLGIAVLLIAATCFAANHLAARISFDHGTSVPFAITVRATTTALVLLVMMRLQGVALALPRRLGRPALGAGLLIALQTSPMLYLLLSWALGREAPRGSALLPMLLALAGLALALDLRPEQLEARWNEIGAGVLWAFASGASMAVVYALNAGVLRPVDGRLRTFAMMSVTALLVFAGGAAAGAHAPPADATGWLGLVCLTIFYCIAMISLFLVLPRVPAASTAALNFEPIALLGLGWVFLGHHLTPLQLLGAFLTVGAIAWVGAARK